VCEADEGPGGIVIFYLVPAGAEVGCQLPQPADRPAVRRRAGVADDDVDYVEFPFDPGCDAGRVVAARGVPRRRGDGRHDALGRFPQDLRLVPLEVLESSSSDSSATNRSVSSRKAMMLSVQKK
jgi:hypothetical protein